MQSFSYKGVLNGQNKSGIINSNSEIEAKSELGLSGLTDLEISPVNKRSAWDISRLFQRVTLVQRLFFTQNLEVMIRTGFSLSLALETISKQVTNKYFKEVIESITREVRSGVNFADALGKHKDVFSDVFISMIAAGEASGKLEEVLKRLTIQLKKDHQLIAKVKNALTYPIIVLIAMVVIGIAVVVFVVPKLVTVFTESRVELPLPTRILIGTSNFLVHYGYIALIVVVFLVVLINRLMKRPGIRMLADRFVLRLPIAGPIVKKIHLALFSRTLSSLLETDIHIVESFQIISKMLSNSFYKLSVKSAADRLKTGAQISTVLGEYPSLFTPILVQMISVGEQSGTLDQVSGEIAEFYEADVDDTMSNLSTIIEPLLMLVLGGAVALLAISILLPIYSLTETI